MPETVTAREMARIASEHWERLWLSPACIIHTQDALDLTGEAS